MQNIGAISDGPTLVTLGNFKDPVVLVGLLGIVLVLILSALPQKNKALFWINKFSVIIAIVVMGIVCACLGTAGIGIEGGKSFSTFYDASYHISNIGSISKIFGSCFMGFDVFAQPISYALVFALLFVDFFDTTGTLVGVEAGAGMIDRNGNMLVDDKPAMVVDAIGTVAGAICGTTTVTSFVESTTGVAAGARTGLASVVTGLLFALSLLIYPGLAMFSCSAATGLALVYVGICMFKSLEQLDWKDWVAVASGFITTLFMCVSYSIPDGIAMGFITYSIMTLASGKFKKSDLPVAICSIAFVAIYVVKYAVGLK